MDRSEVRRVLYDGEEIGARLKEIAAGWQIAPVAEELRPEGPGGTVIVTDGRRQKAEALRAAIEENLLRVICIIGPGEAPGRWPSFAAIEAPAALPLLRQMIDAAFENMALVRRQCALERARSDIGLLNESYSVQRTDGAARRQL